MKFPTRFIKFPSLMLSTLALAVLGGCGSGGGGDTTTTTTTTISNLSGSAIDGPMALANVSVYSISVDGITGDITISDSPLSTGTTSTQGQLQNISMPAVESAPYLMMIEAVDGQTVDLNTCAVPGDVTIPNCSAPVVSVVKTVITADMINAGANAYATPLTTMVSELAINYANADGALTIDGFVNTHIPAASQNVASTFGFGLDSGIDILTTPPIIDDSTDTAEEQQATAEYRAAIAATVALLEQMSTQTADDSIESLIGDLMNDLADGEIDGNASGAPIGNYTTEDLDLLAQDPAVLLVPGTSYTVSEVAQMLVDEQSVTGSTTDTTSTSLASTTVAPAPVETNPDIDGDGVPNTEDAFPENPSESADNDSDGIGDNSDPDDDNDGVLDADDAYPLDATQWTDATATATDGDADGYEDGVDNCPAVYNPAQLNTDTLADGGDACDSDDDEDGTPDTLDAFPLNPAEDTDTDGDGIGNNSDTDDDNDGIEDDAETNTGAYSTETDPITNPLLTDTDGDGWFDNVDEAPTDDTSWYNLPPVARDDAVTTDEDVTVTINLAANDSDTDGTITTYTVPATTTGGIALINNGNGTVDFTPPADSTDSDSFTYIVTDNGGKSSNVATVLITVTAVNDAPVITQGATTTVDMSEDGSPTTFSLTLDATDSEGDTITWSISSEASNGMASASGTGTSMVIGYAPDTDWNGTDAFDVQVTDGTDSNTITVTVNVAAVNDAPNAVADSAGVLVNSSSNAINVLANDSDTEGASLTITAVDNPSTELGTVSTDGATVIYTPATDFSGTDTFTYTVSDGTDTSVAMVTVTVSSNQSPVITEGATTTVNMDEDGSPTAFSLTLNATDAESDTLTWSISSPASNGTATASGIGNSLVVGYTPDANFSGSDSFGVQVSDGTSSDTIVVTVNVVAQNDAPEITEGAITTVTMDEDGSPTTFNLTLNATDPDGDAITWSISGGASNGVASTSGTGASKVINYSPALNFNGTDSFTVQISDGTLTDTIVVNVDVQPQNDAPTISGTAPSAIVGSSYSFTPTSDDADGDTLTFSCTGCPTGWTGYNFNTGTGEISGTPSSAGTVSGVTIIVNDGTTSTELGPFDITVTAIGAVWDNFNWNDGSNWQ